MGRPSPSGCHRLDVAVTSKTPTRPGREHDTAAAPPTPAPAARVDRRPPRRARQPRLQGERRRLTTPIRHTPAGHRPAHHQSAARGHPRSGRTRQLPAQDHPQGAAPDQPLRPGASARSPPPHSCCSTTYMAALHGHRASDAVTGNGSLSSSCGPPVLLQMWTPRPCACGLLPRGTRSATAGVSLPQWSRPTELLGTDPFRETMPKHDAGRCPFGSSPSRSASTRSI